jgi:hypothetical protein
MHDRVNASSAPTQRPMADAIANVALILNVTAFVALAIGLGQIGYGSAALAASLGIVAVLCFAASLVCFAADKEATPAPQLSAMRLPRV